MQDRETAPDIEQLPVQRGDIPAHLKLLRWFLGPLQETFPVKDGFLDRRVNACADIDDSEAAVGKTGAFRIEMGERRHDGTAARSDGPSLPGNQRKCSHLFADARVRQALYLGHGFEILGSRDAIPGSDRWKAARDDSMCGMPIDLQDWSGCGIDQCYPRCASRYCRTAYRSPTFPPSIRSSALRPPKRGAVFGLEIHASARSASGKRICKAL